MSQRMARIEGMMINSGGDLYHVWLEAAIAELPGPYEVKGAQIARLDLATGVSNLPDGDYILEYFYRKPFHGNARIKSGRLVVL
jgi:hypothetical protein